MPENAKLERVLMGLFCSEISAMSLRPLKAKALIFVMLLESKLSFFKCLNLEKAVKIILLLRKNCQKRSHFLC